MMMDHDQEYLAETRMATASRTAGRYVPTWKWNSSYLPYLLLALSYLLIFILFGVVFSKVATLSSELSKIDSDFLEQPATNDSLCKYRHTCSRVALIPDNGNILEESVTTSPLINSQAKDWCRERDSQLVIINNMDEQNFLQAQTRNQRYWIGLTDKDTEGIWRWLDGSDSERGFKYWKAGEPNDEMEKEDCAHLWINGEWNDVSCTYAYYYICEKAPYKVRTLKEGQRPSSS